VSDSYKIDLDAEELLALSGDLPKYVQQVVGGRRIHKSTVYRWALRGVRGRRLPTVRVARQLYTSKGAFSWWASKLADDLVPAAPIQEEESLEPDAINGIEDVLRRAGIRD